MGRFVTLIFLVFLLSGCSSDDDKIMVGLDNDLKAVVRNYFSNFNDVYKYSKYSTNNFVQQVYIDCTGDQSNTKTIDQIKEELHKINLQTLRLKDYQLTEFRKIDEAMVSIRVRRTFENNSSNNITYIIAYVDGSWKFDKIIRL